jgi:phage-related baseplate assembly protein
VIEWAPAVDVDPGEYAEIQALVEEAVEEVRELGDRATVDQAAAATWSLTAVLHLAPGPDPATVVAEAEARLRAYDLAERAVRHPRPLSAIHAALTVPGVVMVELTDPTADVETTGAEYLELDSVTLTTQVAAWLD